MAEDEKGPGGTMSQRDNNSGLERIEIWQDYRGRGLAGLFVSLLGGVIGLSLSGPVWEATGSKLLALAVWLTVAAAILCGLIYSIRNLIKSRWKYFLFDGGIVRKGWGPSKKITWPQVKILYFFPRYRASEKSTIVMSLQTDNEAMAFEVRIVGAKVGLMTQLVEACRPYAIVVNDILQTGHTPPDEAEVTLRDRWKYFADGAARRWRWRGIAYALAIPPWVAAMAAILIWDTNPLGKGLAASGGPIMVLRLLWLARDSFRRSARYATKDLNEIRRAFAADTQPEG